MSKRAREYIKEYWYGSVIHLENYYQEFFYKKETWALVFVQNNAEITGANPVELLKEAWNFFKEYLEWEDKNLEAKFN